ncbi:hypothetical protein KP77_13440 [Jeotgalibacillus alimentarius]|uniref:DUF4247 domain-containing protein n=1 Tax=Jeotgalibacillus alimentarius TaxID=135826 RepID=A0A0C2S9S1_9BACL|nr:DUF4247 domain-containing protein [Jeotgalibacillus alimentarius]KIL50724.1 hypothetical protein KP77_13440 [Jeotgalibacillus alimentarius]
MKRSIMSVLIVAVMMFTAACGNSEGSIFKDGIEDYISTTYTLYDTVESAENSDRYARIYQAENTGLSAVSDSLQSHETPDEMSEINNGKQIFIYDNVFVTLTESEEDADNIMIEVAEQEFARNNYGPSFFEGYLLASLISNIFGNNWYDSRSRQCSINPERCYGGYNSAGSYVGKNSTPTIRGSSNRGGGVGFGK